MTNRRNRSARRICAIVLLYKPVDLRRIPATSRYLVAKASKRLSHLARSPSARHAINSDIAKRPINKASVQLSAITEVNQVLRGRSDWANRSGTGNIPAQERRKSSGPLICSVLIRIVPASAPVLRGGASRARGVRRNNNGRLWCSDRRSAR